MNELKQLMIERDWLKHQLLKEIRNKEKILSRSQSVYLRQKEKIADLKKRLTER